MAGRLIEGFARLEEILFPPPPPLETKPISYRRRPRRRRRRRDRLGEEHEDLLPNRLVLVIGFVQRWVGLCCDVIRCY